MANNDSLVQLIKDLTSNLQDDSDPNNIVIQQFQSPYEQITFGETVTLPRWNTAFAWLGASLATFYRYSTAYNIDNSVAQLHAPRFQPAATRLQPGWNGQGIMIEEGTTNLSPTPLLVGSPGNPVGSGTTWGVNNTGGGDFVYTQVTTNNPFNVYCLTGRLQHTVGAGSYVANTGNLGALGGRAFTFSIWLYGIIWPAVDQQCTITISDTTNANSTSLPILVTRDGWHLYSFTKTFPAGVTNTNVKVALTTPTIADMLMYQAQIEEKPYVTSYIDTVRQGEVLTVPSSVINPSAFTVEINYTLNSIPNDAGSVVFSIGQDLNHSFMLLLTHNTWQLRVGTGLTYATQTIVDNTFAAEMTYAVAVRYSNGKAELLINGVKKLENALTWAPDASDLYIGSCSYAAGSQLNAIVNDFKVSKVSRTDAEIQNITDNDASLVLDANTTCMLDFDGDIVDTTLSLVTFNWNQGGQYAQSMEVMTCLMLI